MYKLFLCLRYLRRRRIAFLSVAAVCLCTAMVLIVVSVMNGFLQMVIDRSRGMLGDLIMQTNSLQGFPYYQEFIDHIKKDPDLKDRIYEATPVIINYGVIRFTQNQITNYASIVGIRMDETCRVNDFGKSLFYEKYYPGTTTFKPQGEPRLGRDAEDRYVLPADLEAARAKWEKSASAEELASAWRSEVIPYSGPGLFLPVDILRDPLLPRESVSPAAAYEGPKLPGAILGADLVTKRTRKGDYERDYYNRGAIVSLTFVPFTESGKLLQSGTGVPSKLFRYVDDCRTGVYDIDSMSVYVDFDLVQEVLNMKEDKYTNEDGSSGVMPGRTTQVQIKLTPGTDPLATRDLLQAKWAAFCAACPPIRYPSLLREVQIVTWKEKQEKYIGAVEKEKYLVTTLFGVISVVAVILIVCIFYMIVQQKTRDIGIIKSVGATAFGVAQIFLAYGAAVGIVGGGIGTIIGYYFVRHINEVQSGLEWFGNKIGKDLQVWNPEVYAFDRIPNQVQLSDAIAIYAVAILMSIVGSVIAAWQASRVWPVEALRYE